MLLYEPELLFISLLHLLLNKSPGIIVFYPKEIVVLKTFSTNFNAAEHGHHIENGTILGLQ